jgi:FixJ family two-component response regulator
VLLHVLHEAGYQVLLVSREADTLAALRRLGAGCLLILEAKLPDAASEAILQGMTVGPAPISCPVVLLSGPPVEARSSNVVGVLRKPFELTRMLAVVKAFCPSPALPPSPARGSAPAAA